MYMTPTNSPEQRNPMSSQYPLRPASRASAFRINVLKSVRLHLATALMVSLLVLGLGLAVVAKHKPTYWAAATIYVSPTPIKTLVEDRELEQPYDSYIAETMKDITSYSVLADALHKMAPGTWQYPGESERSAIFRLQKALSVNHVGMTYQVEISIEGPHPEHLADIVNTVSETYISRARSDKFFDRDERLASLKAEQTRIQTESDALLQEQDKITKALGVSSASIRGSNNLDNDNAKVQSDLTAAREQRFSVESQLAALNNGDPSASNSALNAAADEIIASDPSLEILKKSLSQKRADLVDKLNNLTEANPQRKAAEDQLTEIDKEIQDMQNKLRRQAAARLEAKLHTQLVQAQTLESKLNGELQQGTRQAVDTTPKLQREGEIEAQLGRLQARQTDVDTRISNLELESSAPGSAHLNAPAMTPLGPEKSKVAALLIAIFPLAICAGIFVAVLLDLLDPHIYTATDVEAVLGFAPLGMLFDDREVTQIVFDECALRLAAGVDHASRDAGARTFVITAVNSGAGTSSIVENLGSMLAKLGRRTLVIDPSGNAEPVAFVTLGSEMLKRPVQFPDTSANAPVTTELQRSRPSVPSIPTRVSSTQGLVFERFKNISADYDIVLIDAAPILISAETEYLARMADVTVLIAEAGKTKKAWLTRAARLLERLGISGAAAVVNKVHPARIEEALKHDLREFELRSDRVSLQEWWKPGRKSGQAASMSSAPFDRRRPQPDEEESVFAQDI
jgi:uncharacterized protein involved in exopolysaccharide biosynthesis/MinD-like ATPase involved in chromosome partitioning or flagellar assembly